MQLLRVMLNGWLASMAAAGVLRIVGGLVQAATGSRLVLYLVGPVEFVALAGCFFALVVAALTPKLPKRALIGPMVVMAWLTLGAMPVSVIWFQKPPMHLILGAALLLAAGSAELLLRTAGHGRWGLKAEPLGETLEGRWGPALTWLGAWAVGFPVVAAVYLLGSISWAVAWGTAGFLSTTPTGLAAAHKVYVRGPDTVDLIAMVHIGEEEGYEQLFAAIPREGTLVLAEGVSDKDGLLGGHGAAYDKVAGSIGLSQQRPIQEIAPLEVQIADVDVSTFDPVTLELLNLVFALYGSAGSPEQPLLDYMAFWSSRGGQTEEVMDTLMGDILLGRNDHVLAELETALPERDRVVIPWGALHMVGIEESLRADGWTQTEARKVELIRWTTLMGAARSGGSGAR